MTNTINIRKRTVAETLAYHAQNVQENPGKYTLITLPFIFDVIAQQAQEELDDLEVLARVGDLYLRSLDQERAGEYLTFGEASLLTRIREAVERRGYDVRWETEPDD